MPLCGGGKTVHRKLVLLYGLATFLHGQFIDWNLIQRRWRLRQDLTAQRIYQRVGLIVQNPAQLI